jgi:hypothetical protein
MVFLIFLASVVAMEWIVRRQPGIRQQDRRIASAEDTIAAPTAIASTDIACLAKALADQGRGAKPMPAAERVVSKRAPS